MGLIMNHYLFPLSVFLLPKGITQLRIFEPRYLRMVESCLEHETGFVMAMQEGERVCQYGTLVKVNDVRPMENGTLGIEIKGMHVVKIHEPYQEEDGLWTAKTERTAGWQPTACDAQIHQQLSQKLQSLFHNHPELSSLYKKPEFNDPAWVCARFLEISQLATNQKQWYLAQPNHLEAMSYLSTMVVGSRQLH
ncbi:LON peptidase substrate-binding domain-containing protein [Thaumasiovibrio subtropicus]|uniref:LON peptidase substrate-binding domain-containing protein n=1 Tax=Thaumasiovibrio subtropicus TaxID=1891207 RepID=UPI000B360572|nr:LON peptidase substrate-binding domain-containing protein [Thaumasiovibrio subtropicus]